jgi:hypothetical protein
MRVLVGGVASIALILAGALAMDWYRLSFEPTTDGVLRIAVDLRNVHLCHLTQLCVSTPLAPLPGMFPTLAAVTMWSSLGVAGLAAFQAGTRILTGGAYESVTRLGYMVSLMAVSIAVATAYMFGPESEGAMIGAAAQAGVVLHRTWGPLTLIAGLIGGFATLYIAVAPESSDRGAAYKPVHLPPARALSESRTRTPVVRIPFPEHTGLFPMPGRGATGTAASARPPGERKAVGSTAIPFPERPERPTAELAVAGIDRPRGLSPDPRARPTTDLRSPRAPTMTGIQPMRAPTAVGSQPIGLRPPTSPPAAAPARPPPRQVPRSTDAPAPGERPATGVHAVGAPARPTGASDAPGAPPSRTKSGPVAPVPEHLRNRLSYVAITAELTGGGIDARREDGSSRLVLWRDVVGVVARRMPPAYDATVFVDVVSAAGSTLRIVPWTRLTGEPIAGELAERPRGVIEHVLRRCPGARLDPATRNFLATDEVAQLPDLATLRAHDERLA